MNIKKILKEKFYLYKKFLSNSPENTKKISQNITKEFQTGDVVGLIGELGSGKTYFIKGIARNYGISSKEVISPTFVLMRIYNGKKIIHHFDLYRIKNNNELENIGYRDSLAGADLIVIEWADKIKEIYDDYNWIIIIKYISKKQRKISIYKSKRLK
jgi:tRNA threonylcarbamoyladenosine biosynthesis protein TsaE